VRTCTCVCAFVCVHVWACVPCSLCARMPACMPDRDAYLSVHVHAEGENVCVHCTCVCAYRMYLRH